jgi:glucose-1-phosphate cytidylyltransferase
MKVIILAGGLGTRISEETQEKPKPMVKIGDYPILWHILQIYVIQGFNDFVIAAGYKSDVIRNWINQEKSKNLDWIKNLNIEVKDTGEASHTGGRLAMCINEIQGETFLATYGDGVANVDIKKLIRFHENTKGTATLTAVRPPARFGHVDIYGDTIKHFGEKNQTDEGWINGGFFIVNRGITDYIDGPNEPLEIGALPKLAKSGKLMAYKHYGFWQPMDTLRDKEQLTQIVKSTNINQLPWLSIK